MSDRISIVIKTIDRVPSGGKNYLGTTLSNLERGGVFSSQHLASIDIVDGGTEDWDAYRQAEINGANARVGGGINCQSEERTLQQNGQRCIEHGAIRARETGAAWVLVIEDDIDVCGRFLESVVAWLAGHVEDHRPNLYALGACYTQIDWRMRGGHTWWNYPVGSFYGAQALAWRTEDATSLAKWLGPNPQRGGDVDSGHDLLLGDWGKAMGLTYFVASAPSLVQHIGKQSSIDNRFFTFLSWQGQDWAYGDKVATSVSP